MPRRISLFYIAIFILGTVLLTIFAVNVPIIGSYKFLWAPLLILYALLFNNSVFRYKNVLAAVFYGALYVGILQYTLWKYANDWYLNAILEDFYAMIVFVLLFSILVRNNYQKEWIQISKVGLVFIVITGCMTIITTNIEPLIVRASYSTGKNELANYDFLSSFGFGTYGYMSALVSLFPVLIYFYKMRNSIWLPKIIWFLLILFFYFVLIRSQVFANIIVATLIIFLSFFGDRRFYKSILYISLISVFLLLIPKDYYIKLLVEISYYFSDKNLIYEKINDLAIFLQEPIISEIPDDTQISTRVSRYPDLFKAFSRAPFTGDASHISSFNDELATGAHLYWMSRLTLWGILGFSGYLIILRFIFKPVFRLFDDEFKFYYYLSILAVILLGLMKSLGGRESYAMLLIVIPGLYLLTKKNQFSLALIFV